MATYPLTIAGVAGPGRSADTFIDNILAPTHNKKIWGEL